jgi:hypothetical protein
LIVSLLEDFQTSRLTRDWPAMRALLHPAARLESLAAVGEVLSAAELVQAIRTASLRGLYAVKSWRVDLIRPQIGLAEARVRYESTPGAITDEPRRFLASDQDGLIWRMRIFHDLESAQRCLRENGVHLGL